MRLGLISFAYLRRMSSQGAAINVLLDDGSIEVVLVRMVCPPGLLPCCHLGRTLRALRDGEMLATLRERWDGWCSARRKWCAKRATRGSTC